MAQQWFLPSRDIKVDQDEIQGDVLVGLQKKAEIFLFFTIQNVADFKTALADFAGEISYLRETRVYEETHSGPLEKANIAFTIDGLRKLGKFAGGIPTTVDSSFAAGARARAPALGDDVAMDWRPVFRDETFDGLILIAAWDPSPRAALTLAREKALQVTATFGASILEAHREEAMVRSTSTGGVQKFGHEHFGFADGVSQPGIKDLTLPVAKGGTQGFPGQDLVEPGDFVLGSQYAREDGHDNTPPEPWMENGSYLVFRRLNQNVTAFDAYVAASWPGLANDADQFAARLVGRWKDGSPIVRNPSAPEATETEEHPEKNNGFDFGLEDPAQVKCPFAAHIRRIYPRGDLANDASEKRRIIRAGIAFGTDEDVDKGLLFVCYQSSITDKFEFIQQNWANNPTFPNGPQNPQGMSIPAIPGIDMLIGQGPAPRTQEWDSGTLPVAPKFVTATGGGYFFSPSKSGLADLAR